MKIKATPLQRVSFECDIDRIMSIDDDILKFETVYSYKGKEGKPKGVFMFKFTFQLVFTNADINTILLHYIGTFGISLTNDGAKIEDDEQMLWAFLEFNYECLWNEVRANYPDLYLKHLNEPYVDPKLTVELMNVLKSAQFYQ